MADPRWGRVKSLVADALERPPAERGAFLQEACAADDDLPRRVERLLELETSAGEFLEHAPIMGGPETGEPPPPPKRIGSYRITRHLAAGGSGAVYEAVQESPHRTIALKLLHAHAGGSGLAQRFRRESEVLAHLQHPNIAHVYEAGIHDDGPWRVPFIAMELVRDARTIVAYAETDSLSPEERVRLLIEICRAVQYGHERGVIHRDLKPANLLVDGAGHAKVIDFGVARVTTGDDRLELTVRTSENDLIGTLPYMSPEQCAGDVEAIDARTDVYALGVVLFEMLAGRLPLDLAGMPLEQAIQTIRLGTPARLGRVRPDLGGDLDAITAKALEKDPARRYRTAAGLAADLQRWLDHEPVVARPPSVAHQARLFARRHRIAVTAAVLTAVALVGATAVSAAFAVSARRAAASEARERETVQRVNEYLRDMLLVANPHERGAEVTVLEMVDRMGRRLDVEDGVPPRVEAPVRAWIGETYLNLGRFESAIVQLRRADELRASAGTPDDGLPHLMNMLGLAFTNEDRLEEAEAAFRRGVAAARKTPDRVQLSNILGNLATLLIDAERIEEAEPIVREVLERRRIESGPRSLPVAASLRQLARLQRRLGDPAAAEALLLEARSILAEIVPEHHPIYASTLFQLGAARRERGDLDGALEAHDEAWRIASSARSVGSRDWLMAMEERADSLNAIGRGPECADHLRRALALLVAEHGPDDERAAGVRERLAKLAGDEPGP